MKEPAIDMVKYYKGAIAMLPGLRAAWCRWVNEHPEDAEYCRVKLAYYDEVERYCREKLEQPATE